MGAEFDNGLAEFNWNDKCIYYTTNEQCYSIKMECYMRIEHYTRMGVL